MYACPCWSFTLGLIANISSICGWKTIILRFSSLQVEYWRVRLDLIKNQRGITCWNLMAFPHTVYSIQSYDNYNPFISWHSAFCLASIACMECILWFTHSVIHSSYLLCTFLAGPFTIILWSMNSGDKYIDWSWMLLETGIVVQNSNALSGSRLMI